MRTLIFNKTRSSDPTPPGIDHMLGTPTWTNVVQRLAKPTWTFFDCFKDMDKLILHDDAFAKLLSDVQDSKSPGLPFAYEFSTNGDIKTRFAKGLKGMLEQRLRALRCYGQMLLDRHAPPLAFDNLDTIADRSRFIAQGLVDPVRVFAKNEPHTDRKVGRDICSVSILDSMVERVLYAGVLDAQVMGWKKLSATIGIDLDTPAETVEFYERVVASIPAGFAMASTDVRAYEYKYREHSENKFLNVMLALHGKTFQHVTDPFVAIAFARSLMAMRPIYVLSNGMLVVSEVPNQLSGRFVTTLANSITRMDCADSVARDVATRRIFEPHTVQVNDMANAVVAMPLYVNGDDALEIASTNQAEMVEFYKRQGLDLTDFSTFQRGDSFVYCSHIFTPQGAYPENPVKLIAKFLMGKRSPEQTAAVRQSLARCPDKSHLEKLDAFLSC